MGSSSSSSEEEKLTIVVSPVELSVVPTDAKAFAKDLEALAKKFDMPVTTLVQSGCIQVFRGSPLELVIPSVDVRARL